MTRILILLLELWRHRYYILVPALLLPLIFLFWSIGNPAQYTASTTLSLARDKALSPLLKNITEPEHEAILNRTLKSSRVLRDALMDAGIILEGTPEPQVQEALSNLSRNVELRVLNDHLIRLTYRDNTPEHLSTTLEALSHNFIYEILAPERLRSEQQLATLGEQIKYYTRKIMDTESLLPNDGLEKADMKELVAREFDLERLRAQRKLAQEEFDNLLALNKDLVSQGTNNQANGVLWFVETPIVLPVEQNIKRHISHMLHGLALAIVLSTCMLVYLHFSDTSIHNEDELRLVVGARILGHIPNLGDVRVENDRLTATVRARL